MAVKIIPLDELRERVRELMARFEYDWCDLKQATQVDRAAARRFMKGGSIAKEHQRVLSRWSARYR